MDLKEMELKKEKDSKTRKKSTSHLLSSALKYSEAFHKKYFSKNSSPKPKTQPSPPQQQPSQVSRKGRRPLSAFLVGTSFKTPESVPDDMSDSEEDSARRLQRSKIIASFLSDQESKKISQNETSKF